MHTQTVHCLNSTCTQPETILQTVQHTLPTHIALATHTPTTPTPKFCPWCGSTDLIDDQTYHKLRFIQSLDRDGITLTVTMHDKLYAHFRAQSAFKDFREYIECVLFNAPAETDKKRNERLAHERAQREYTPPAKFQHTTQRKANTPLIGQFGGSSYHTPSGLPHQTIKKLRDGQS